MPRLHCPGPLRAGESLALPAGAVRHVQVLRLQPGDPVTLFDGTGGEWDARIERMGRGEAIVGVGEHRVVDRESPRAVHLALGMPANERMDWLVEKATELGVASIQPLTAARSVLRLSGERAERKQAHWQAIAVAACEQCGRNRVPDVAPVKDLGRFSTGTRETPALKLVLSLAEGAQPLWQACEGSQEPVLLLSGPEGGLTPDELAAATDAGFRPVTLGPRVLRAETAPLAALAFLLLSGTSP
jgi:16S rRNA (uracil1498-N3)-methyltransferase